MSQTFNNDSPKWNWTTKLVVGLAIVAVLGWLILQFRAFLGPLLLAFILTYLSHPASNAIRRVTHLSWRLSVTVFYLLLAVVIIGLLTLGGLALLQQGQSLLSIVQNFANVTLPNFIQFISTNAFVIGPFKIDFRNLGDLTAITNQILGYVQPLLGQVGTLLTTVASSAASFLGWISFIWLISYFIAAESGDDPAGSLLNEIPGYASDFKRMTFYIDRIWNTFLRGQLLLFVLTVIIFSIVLTVFGVHYSLGLALISGFGRFLPYVGPFIAWATLGLVAYFQGSTIFGLSALGYLILVVGSAMVIDSIFDNIISPKVFSSSLKVHPAAVLITALVAANMIGVVGVLVAGPVLATLQLLSRYTLRKMFDIDPWVGIEPMQASEPKVSYLDRLLAAYLWLKAQVMRLLGLYRQRRSRPQPPTPKEERRV